MRGLVLALSLNPHEQAVVAYAVLATSVLSAVGFLVYKLAHVLEGVFRSIAGGAMALVDFFFDVLTRVERRRAELVKLRQELRAGSARSRSDEPPPATTG
jgi:hypothetical protein